MTEHFSFFDAVLQDDGVTYDREYNAQQFTKYFGTLVTTGVMKGMGNMLAVSATGSNMVTKINTGIAFVEGKYYENDSFKELTHDTETLGNSRIDRIVVRMDLSTEARYVKAFIKKGVPSTSPVAPTLTQTPNLYEISLAQVKIVGGQTFIAINAVTDERGKEAICPWAGSKILPSFDDNALSEHIHKIASATESGHIRPDGKTIKVDPVTGIASAVASTSYYVEARQNAGNTTYDVSIPDVTEYKPGLTILMKLLENNKQGAASLNINGLGAKTLVFQTYGAIAQNAGELQSGRVYQLVYDGLYFTIIGVQWSSSYEGGVDSVGSPHILASYGSVGKVNAKVAAIQTQVDSKATKNVSTVNIPLVSGWAGLAQITREDNGMLTLYFDIYGGTKTSGTKLGTIPAGYRPIQTYAMYFGAVTTTSGTVSPQGAVISIYGSGDIYITSSNIQHNIFIASSFK